MDPDKRKTLLRKREEHQAQTDLNKQKKLICRQINYLVENSLPFEILFGNPATEWMMRHLPIREYGTGHRLE